MSSLRGKEIKPERTPDCPERQRRYLYIAGLPFSKPSMISISTGGVGAGQALEDCPHVSVHNSVFLLAGCRSV